MRSDDLLKLLTSLQKADIVDITVLEVCSYTYLNISHNISISGCIFKEEIIFTDCHFSQAITFKNCKFEKGICFNRCTFKDSFTLESTDIQEETIFRDCTIASVLFNETHFKDVLFCGYLKNSAIKNEDFVFQNATLESLKLKDWDCYKPFRLNDVLLNRLIINKCTLINEISFGLFEGANFFFADDIYIESTTFKQRVDFFDGNIKKMIYAHKVNFEEQVVFNRNFCFTKLWLAEVRAKYSFDIDFQDNFEDLEINDCIFDTSLSVRDLEKLVDWKKTISINFSGIIKGNYIIEEIPTISIHFSGINYGNIICQNINTKFITFTQFRNFSNTGKVLFSSIHPNQHFNALIINDSNLGNTEFENIDFRNFNEFVIVKSDVSNVILSNSLFPKIIQIASKNPTLGYGVRDFEKINDNMYYRDSYRQLKLAMEKMGNRYYALVYKSKEMYYHRKELNWGWDKLLLYINYLSNNNGISWIRGILFTLICAWFSFIALNSQLEQPFFYWTTQINFYESIKIFHHNIGHFISYLSSYPILKLDGLKDSWLVDLIVLLSRIFISVGIYQIVVAFRKYSNKI